MPRIPFVHLGSHHTSRSPVAYLLIVLIQGFVVVQFISHHTEHVVVEDLTISPFFHEGIVGLVLHLGKFPAKIFRQFRLLVCRFTGTLAGCHKHHDIVIVYLVEHRLVDGPQHHICCLLSMLTDTFHRRLQRVGCDGCHRLSTGEFSLQQLSVGFLLCRLLHNLLQHLILGLGQVFVSRLPCFLPESTVCLSK